jgi:hypothetical protein
MPNHEKHDSKYASPYDSYQDTPLWEAVNKAVCDLIRNGDLVEKTDHKLVIGYITQFLIHSGVAKS